MRKPSTPEEVKTMRKFRNFALLFAVPLATMATAVSAKEPKIVAELAPAVTFDMRVEQLVPVLNGQIAYEAFFTPSFLAAVPPAQIKAISDSFTQQYGKALSVQSVQRNGTNNATLQVEYEKAVATIEITTEASPPFKVAGLLAKGFAVKGDSIDKIKT
ncbi:MAG: hypothetical protein KA312_05185, partial [Sphingorhabdus sp.]|nr:hypothetical protein [Sphingorhabdus sp.]